MCPMMPVPQPAEGRRLGPASRPALVLALVLALALALVLVSSRVVAWEKTSASLRLASLSLALPLGPVASRCWPARAECLHCRSVRPAAP